MEHPTKLSAWRHPRAAGKGQTGVEGLMPGRFITRMSHGGSLGDSVGKGLTRSKVYLVHCTTCKSKDQLSEAMADDLFKAVGPEYISYACRQAALLPVQQVLHIWRGQPSKRNTWLVSKEGTWRTRKRGQGVIGRINIPSLLAVEDEVPFLRMLLHHDVCEGKSKFRLFQVPNNECIHGTIFRRGSTLWSSWSFASASACHCLPTCESWSTTTVKSGAR